MIDYREQLRAGWRHRRNLSGERRSAPGERTVGVLGGDATSGESAPRRQRRQVLELFLKSVDQRNSTAQIGSREARHRVGRLVDEAVASGGIAPLDARERAKLEDQVVAEIRGLGPLEPLFSDPTVSDILVNGPDEVWVDRFGRLERTRVRFDDGAHLVRILGRLVGSQGRHLDEASPHVDVRLPDGSRLHALIPPLSVAPVVSIRRMRPVPFRLEELAASGTISGDLGSLFAAAVRGRLNILISGGTASGKTTLLNVLAALIPHQERVITIEETVELRFAHPHVVTLEARLPNIEGNGEVSLRALVKNALRMRPDRILVGEVRGPEAFDMLQAMNTGHEGSLTTVHANSPEDALRRLENLVQMGGFELPSAAIRELLGAAFDLVIQMNRFRDGSRRVTAVREVQVVSGELVTRELFRFEPEGGGRERGAGRHVATGIRPAFLPRLAGIAGFSEELFEPAGEPLREKN
ncbi:MAG TPA: CpaF family protein [Thermoanaerobaculia bacterium]|jgi:pilus assembly protein CpaF|nr:CpaF family protein [Thermoanaerobaculia bacterium]